MTIPEIESTANAELSTELAAAINNKTKPLGSLGAEVIWQQGERMGIRFNANPMLIASIIGGALKL